MLSDKDRELIGIGASIAAGCQPCARFHLHAARLAGASDAETSQAISASLDMSRRAAEVMAQFASHHSGMTVSDTSASQEITLIGELVSISAACARNSVPDLEAHITAARRLKATDIQILAAIRIAGDAKRVAAVKLEEAAGRAIGGTPAEKVDGDGHSEENVSEEALWAPAEERPGTGDCRPQCVSGSQVKCQHN